MRRGDLLIDSAMHLETNATKGLSEENTMMLQHCSMRDDAVVKMQRPFAPAPMTLTQSIMSIRSAAMRNS